MIKAFLLRWLFNFIGLGAAAALLNGVNYGNSVGVLLLASLIFSIVNAFIRPLVIILALPAILLTLGLFTFVVNGFMLYLVTLIYPPLQVTSFGQALLAVVIIWLVNYVLSSLREGKRVATI